MKSSLVYRIAFLVLAGSSVLLGAGCASTLKDSLSKIESGMDKSDVIDRTGSPNRSYRHDEQDIWLYRVQDDGRTYFHEVSFKEGRVVYSGEERDLKEKKGSSGLRSSEEAQELLRQKLKPNKKPVEFKDVKDDGSL